MQSLDKADLLLNRAELLLTLARGASVTRLEGAQLGIRDLNHAMHAFEVSDRLRFVAEHAAVTDADGVRVMTPTYKLQPGAEAHAIALATAALAEAREQMREAA